MQKCSGGGYNNGMKFKPLFVFAIFLFSITLLSSAKLVFADSTSGYAWSENSAWIDFSQVTVSSSVLSGYAYSPNIGWISLNCDNTSSCGTVDYKVTNTSGTLSGYAWSENTGYVDFSKATISTSTGIFSGYAYSPNTGWMSLNCSNTSSCGTVDYKVTSAWRPPTSPAPSSGYSSGGGRIITQCNNGVDDDHDGTIDLADPDCKGSYLTASEGQIVISTLPTTLPSATCALNFTQTLKLTIPRMNNVNVKLLQTCLNTKVSSLPLILDGIFGQKSKQAVILFQKNNNIKIDGIVGPITRGLLIK